MFKAGGKSNKHLSKSMDSASCTVTVKVRRVSRLNPTGFFGNSGGRKLRKFTQMNHENVLIHKYSVFYVLMTQILSFLIFILDVFDDYFEYLI